MKNLMTWALCSIVLFLTACTGEKSGEAGGDAAMTADSNSAVAPAEFADMKYAETVKGGLASLSKGDVAAWMANFADNAVYAWNSGDSLAGKAAISEWWTKRRSEVIDSLTFDNEIFLPIKVNTPQSVEAPGVWVLGWWQTTAKYKASGKKMTQWIHSDTHFNADGKIDRVIQYIDMAVVNKAMAK